MFVVRRPGLGRGGAAVLAGTGAADAPFDPTTISSCTLALTTDLTGSSPITLWNDDTSNGYDGTPAGSPSSGTINGLSAPDFDGTDDRFTGTSLANLIGGGTDGDYEIWAITDLTATSAGGGNYHDCAALLTGADGWMGLAVNSSTSVIHGYNDGVSGDVQAVATGSIVDGNIHVVRARLNGGSIYVRVDDGTEASASGIGSHRTFTDAYRIGNDWGGTRWITGTAHIWVFEDPLSAADVTSMYSLSSDSYGATTP